jgi:hypothetical protein
MTGDGDCGENGGMKIGRGNPSPRREASDFFLLIYLVCDAIGTAATPGLLCQPRVIVKMIVEKFVE